MNHKHNLNPKNIRIQLFTLSDTRSIENDESGKLMKKYIQQSPYKLAGTKLIKEDFETLEKNFTRAVESQEIDAIISSGGTGITRRDQAIEVLREISDVELPGFGELFRRLSYEEIGTDSILSRALAARAKKTILVSIPGSPAAVELAFKKILLEALPHMIEMAHS